MFRNIEHGAEYRRIHGFAVPQDDEPQAIAFLLRVRRTQQQRRSQRNESEPDWFRDPSKLPKKPPATRESA